jgi:hypothetical protein
VSGVLPATYPHVLAFPLQVAVMSDRSFRWRCPGLVHVRNRIDVLRAVRADEALDRRCGPAPTLAASRSLLGRGAKRRREEVCVRWTMPTPVRPAFRSTA